MRACPYCAEQIQDAAILCRFCGRTVTPVAESAGARPWRPKLPGQRWYAVDDRVKRASTRAEPKRRPSLWAKIGGAIEALGPSELRAGRHGRRETMVREYPTVRKYQTDVDRLVRAGWEIDHQVDTQDRIVVTWVREPH